MGKQYREKLLEKYDFQRIRYWLESIDKIAVRESSGVKLIEEMGLKAVRTCDPVFLLDEYQWEKIISHVSKNQKYILLYDFEQNCVVEEIAKEIAEEKKAQIISVFKTNIQANIYSDMGPLEFLDLVKNAEFIISNSFHATAFSIIFLLHIHLSYIHDMLDTDGKRRRDKQADMWNVIVLQDRIRTSSHDDAVLF